MKRRRHVALLIETSRAYGRGLIRGISRYIHEHGPWSVYLRPRGLGDPPPRWLKRWQGDGILIRLDRRQVCRVVEETGLPAIDLLGELPDLPLPFIGIHNDIISAWAFRHLQERGFRKFAFCNGPRGRLRWMDLRRDMFQKAAREAGYECDIFEPKPVGSRGDTWEHEQEQIAKWIRGLAKPVGIMACNDERGQEVLDACQRAGVRVPEDVAVIGVDNDEPVCALARPALSSIDTHPEQAGYEAAALLDRLMAGAKPPKKPHWVHPRAILTRQSTDVVATDDELVAEAVHRIREHACEGATVDRLLRELHVSRSTLERRMRQAIGCSPKEEILRFRLNRVKELLVETDLPLAVIADRTAFADLHHLAAAFKREIGQPPGAYRKQFQRIGIE